MAADHGFHLTSKERLLGLFEEEADDNTTSNASILDRIAKKWRDLQEVMVEMFEMGRSDPRLIIFALKSGLTLALVSSLIFLEGPLTYMHQYAVWATLIAIVIFEFSVGATLSRGCSRALGTTAAAVLALGVAQLSVWAAAWHELVVVVSIFITGAISSYVKLHPSMKAYDPGFRGFMMTFSIVLVAGTSHFYRAAISRLFFVGVGAIIVLTVNICIYPIWSGEDLHKLVVQNFWGVATSLEGCVRSYLENIEYERIPSKILIYQATDDPLYTGYRAAISSTGEEDALLGFAIWEPPHGRYRMFRYPWDQFIKVSGALRHCAFMVMGMHGCILSEIQAAVELRYMFRNEIQRVGIESVKVLRELGNKLEKLERLSPDFDLLEKVHEAAEELQMLIDQKSYHLVHPEKWGFVDPEHIQELKEEETHMHAMGSSTSTLKRSLTFKNPDRPTTNMSVNPSFVNWGSSEDVLKQQSQWPHRLPVVGDVIVNDREVRTYESASALSLINFTSSLIEFVARLQNLVDSYQELSEKARFLELKNDLEKPEDVGFGTRLLKCIGLKN